MSITDLTSPPEPAFDLTPLCARLRDRLALDGAPHPGIGALLLALRGAAGEERATFAQHLAVEAAWLADAEAGQIASEHLPAFIRSCLQKIDGVERSWAHDVLVAPAPHQIVAAASAPAANDEPS